ncbi:hypothetical protein HOLleu_13582 [Holothuria leucospilota]|uniref:Integrase core domain-containing protein n=1 Tax=Holothuria leucospilota TaxID=206669 RepID=A0A9Q1CB94_HOLLE|nr:hypothetical protein HOLleu_13582 [Holothuria leucospilota]
MQHVLDPVGVENRRARRFRRRIYTARGPNFVIHIDGYDKLKPYGFAIHAAIDGFSRKVLWLTVGPSNNNPRIIGNLFMNFVCRLNGVPFIVRADRGTENTLVAPLQAALRWYHDDAFSRERSFLFGRSTSNQRIECWWSQLRRMCTAFWINFFKDMRDEGIFDNSDPVQVEGMRFCFSHLLQEDLDKAAKEWNQHRIRRQRNMDCPAGIPDMMYFVPEVYGTIDYKRPLDFTVEEIREVREEFCSEYPEYGCARWFTRSLEDILGGLDNYQMPTDIHEARRLFVALKDILLE